MNELSGYHTKRLPSIQMSNPPQTTALSWCITSTLGDELASKSPFLKLEIASLTKIMTAYTTLQICEDLNLTLNNISITVPYVATILGGTSAFLRRNDQLNIIDILYGMMLPSGNDAAMTLAIWGGNQLHNTKKQKILTFPPTDTIQGFTDDQTYLYIARFVKQMNENALKLGMRDTQFSNPHGLQSKANKSTASDLNKLSQAFIKNKILKTICNTKEYACKNYNWQNTNHLLNYNNYFGIKTGMTPTAGACLAVAYDSMRGPLIVVLIGAKDQKRRFEETDRLLNWINREYNVNRNLIVPPRTTQSKGRSFIIKKQTCQ